MNIEVRSMLGMDSGQPLVQMQCNEESVIMSTRDARALALNILSAAESGESDWAVFRYLTERADMSVDASAHMISGLRAYRSQLVDNVPGSQPIEDEEGE